MGKERPIGQETLARIETYIASAEIVYLSDIAAILGVNRVREDELRPAIADIIYDYGKRIATPEEAKSRAGKETGKKRRQSTAAALDHFVDKTQYSLEDIANITGLHPTTVSRGLKNLGEPDRRSGEEVINRAQETKRLTGTNRGPERQQDPEHVRQRIDNAMKTKRRTGNFGGNPNFGKKPTP